MDKEPKVSIIMPCFNSDLFLDSAITSVINQTYKNWELIIVDDCSTDNSISVIDKYVNIDKRIKVLSTTKASGSPTVPRNLALENAEGTFIAFLDSDDIWLPTKLWNQLTFFDRNKGANIVICYSNYERISELGIRSNKTVCFPKYHSYTTLLKGNDIVCSSAMINLNILKNKYFFKSIGHEDYEYWLRILAKGFKAANCNSVEVLYRMRKESISSGKLNALKWLWNIHRIELKHSGFKSIYYISNHLFRYVIKNLKILIRKWKKTLLPGIKGN